MLVELIEDTKDAVGDTCAVACRIGVEELLGEEGIHREEMLELFSEISELPDLWDLTLCSWDIDSQTSRFSEEGHEEPFVTGFKQLTTKPVVGVGRFTSPDAMVSQIGRGVLDLIGAAHGLRLPIRFCRKKLRKTVWKIFGSASVAISAFPET